MRPHAWQDVSATGFLQRATDKCHGVFPRVTEHGTVWLRAFPGERVLGNISPRCARPGQPRAERPGGAWASGSTACYFFCAALIFAQRALAARLIAALAAALIVNFFFGLPAGSPAPLIFAHRAFWNSESFLRAAALIVRFFMRPAGAAGAGAAVPSMLVISFWSCSMRSLMEAARRS